MVESAGVQEVRIPVLQLPWTSQSHFPYGYSGIYNLQRTLQTYCILATSRHRSGTDHFSVAANPHTDFHENDNAYHAHSFHLS